MSNYKITFNLTKPISISDTIMFDGILAYCYANEYFPQEMKVGKLHIDKKELIDFSSMPIEQHSDGWFYASWGFYNKANAVESLVHWRKQWDRNNDDLADFGKNKRTVSVARGEFKSHDTQFRILDIGEIWFFFKSEDIKQVDYLLSEHLAFLGKKTSQGYGSFSHFKIEELNYNPFEKERIRPIPTSDAKGFLKDGLKMAYTGWRPPYWLPEHQGWCLV